MRDRGPRSCDGRSYRSIIEKGEFREPYLGVLGYDKAMTSYITSEIMIDTGIFVYDVEECFNFIPLGMNINVCANYF